MADPVALEPAQRGTESAEERRARVAEQLREMDAALSSALARLPGLIRDVRELRAMVEPAESSEAEESEKAEQPELSRDA